MDIEAYILIGGRSSRLGRDKAFAEAGGVSLAQRALNTVKSAGIAKTVTFVAGSQMQFAIEAVTLETPFIFDLVPGRGPLSGLHAALSYARTGWIFVLACDYPLVTPELITLMADRISEAARAIVPEQADGRLQPLCSFYNTSATRPIVTETIELPRVPPPMSAIAEKLSPDVVRFRDYSHLPGAESFFSNVNTPKDLDKVRQILTDSRQA